MVQDRTISEYSARLALDLIHPLIVHDGISGRNRERFLEIEVAVKKYRPGAVVFYQLDRFARDSAGLKDYLKTLAKRNIEVHEAAGAGKLELKRAWGRMVIGIRAEVDEAYADIIGEKTADALRELKDRRKKYGSIAPFGFRYVGLDMIENPIEQRALETLKRCKDAGLGARRALVVLRAGGYSGRQSLKAIHQALKRLT